MSSVSTVFRKDKLNKHDKAPIHFRIIKDRKVKYISSGIMLHKDFWDEEKIKIKGKYPNSARLNSFLTNKFAELQDQVFEHETISKSLTTRQLRDKIYGMKPTDFFSFADEACACYLSAGKVGTYDRAKSTMKKLKEYMKGNTLAFQDITNGFLAKYETHLRDNLHNKSNTIHKDMKFFRKLFNDAYRQEIIELNVNPFLKYRVKLEKTTRVFLTEEELMQFISFQPTPGTRMDLHKDMFVFASYAGGLRVSDILQLKWENFTGTHIQFTVRKTGSQISIKLPDVAIQIISKYQSENRSGKSFIFPMLKDDLDLNDPRAIDSALSSATAYANKSLKLITAKCGITKHVSFHISRHTWATRALKKEISIDKVQRLMGHSNINQTQIYAKIVSSELDKAMDAFN